MKEDSLLNEKLHLLFEKCIALGFPFSIYRLPETEEIQFVVQSSTEEIFIESLDEIKDKSGFVIAPFHADKEHKLCFIRPDFTDFSFLEKQFTSKKKVKVQERKVLSVQQKTFQKYVEHSMEKIGEKKFDKVVTARVVRYKKPAAFNEINYFLKVCEVYKWSFVSLAFVASKGLWFGASPELLLGYSNKNFTTFSLAGTMPNSNKNAWGEKEREEQEIVTKYIQNIASKIPQSQLKIEGPKTVSAGNVQHLLTTFKIQNASHSNWCKLVNELHPTPAVSGFPKQEAIQFIIENEKTNRSFYTGFLGSVNRNGEINLYVNLRCMEIQEKNLILHVGCGVTHDSDSLKEWKETELKSRTLLNLIE